jgi:hypothetical protein
MKNYYNILGIEPLADRKEIKDAYIDKMAELKEAYDNLISLQLRNKHDGDLVQLDTRGQSAGNYPKPKQHRDDTPF